MDLVTMREGWEEYASWPGAAKSPPPEGVFVSNGAELVVGCCMHPTGEATLVTDVVTHPLVEYGTPHVLRFLLRVLEGHQKITNRPMFIDMVWSRDSAGLLVERLDAPSGWHGIAQTEIPTTPIAEDQRDSGESGGTAKTPPLDEGEPTTPTSAVESEPKPPMKARAKPRVRKKKK